MLIVIFLILSVWRGIHLSMYVKYLDLPYWVSTIIKRTGYRSNFYGWPPKWFQIEQGIVTLQIQSIHMQHMHLPGSANCRVTPF